MIRPSLIIMAKAPQLGRVKTRLAADIGKVQALRLYRHMTRRVLSRTSHPKWDSLLAVTPPEQMGRVPAWRAWPHIAQVPGSLSPKLSHIFGSFSGPLAVIGTDCPQVSAAHINAAFSALKSHEAVIGPATDGGFWLLAMRAPTRADIFDKIRWSTPHTLRDLLKNLGSSVHFLEELSDIDDLNSLRAVRSHYPHLL